MTHYKIIVQPSTNEVTQSEFARVIAVSPPTVNQYIKEKRLVVKCGDKKIKVLVNESIERLNATAKLHGVFNDKKIRKKTLENKVNYEQLAAGVKSTQLDLEIQDADILFKHAKALKEKAIALQAAAEHEKFIGALVEKTAVEKLIFERGRQFRDGLMSLSRRLAPVIVGCDNIPEAESLLNKEFRDILEAFCKLPVIEE